MRNLAAWFKRLQLIARHIDLRPRSNPVFNHDVILCVNRTWLQWDAANQQAASSVTAEARVAAPHPGSLIPNS